MNLNFDVNFAVGYKNSTQIARVLTENWVSKNIFCPSCGNPKLEDLPNNSPVADFRCPACQFEYELKSQKDKLANKIVDGAFDSMINRINSTKSPHFFLLNYSNSLRVQDFFVIPSHYFVDDIIEKRKPLKSSARRAGWIGCNILLHQIPSTGKIFYIKNGQEKSKKEVLHNWSKTAFLANRKKESRGWLVQILNILDKIKADDFSLNQVYAYEVELRRIFPNNNFIREKMRQQLQVLRDQGVIEFRGRGAYRKLLN